VIPRACWRSLILRTATYIGWKHLVITSLKGSQVFSFSGSTDAELRPEEYQHSRLNRVIAGVDVTTARGNGYGLVIVDHKGTQVGQTLSLEFSGWADAGRELPQAKTGSAGVSLAIHYMRKPSAEQTLPIILAWYYPGGQTVRHITSDMLTREAFEARLRSVSA
jgi:hypothetical protein